MMQNIKALVNISLLITLYFLVFYIYVGILNPIPTLGDSWDYHIPISISVLDGSFLSHPHNIITGWHYPGTSKTLSQIPQWYYPGSSDAVNSLFILLHIPLTLSNIFAAIVLFFCLWKLALTFRLDKFYSLLFATTFCTLNIVLRWLNAVSIDVWVAVFFTIALILLEKPKKSAVYFAQLGFVLGMLIGSKYAGWFYLVTLSLFYLKDILPLLNLRRVVAFFIPFSIFGLFWYIRNYLWLHNPFYPLSVFGFPGKDIFGGYTVWSVGLRHPAEMLNAAFGEYKLWLFSVLIAIAALTYQYVIRKKFDMNSINKLFFIGFINFLCYFLFPTSAQVWIMVSSFRYSFPAFIPLMLGVFLLASEYKKEELIGYVAIANMINVLSMAYYPKLVIVYLPLSLGIFYLLNRNWVNSSKVQKQP